MAGLVHEFYAGCERILERIAVQIDRQSAGGAFSHSDLLARMAIHQPGVRPAVLDETLRLALQDHLDLRHCFRHACGYTLDWAKPRPLVETMEATLAALTSNVEHFFEVLPQQPDEPSTPP